MDLLWTALVLFLTVILLYAFAGIIQESFGLQDHPTKCFDCEVAGYIGQKTKCFSCENDMISRGYAGEDAHPIRYWEGSYENPGRAILGRI